MESSQLKNVWRQPEIQAIVAACRPFGLYLVGGAVRDLMLGRPVKDFDFLVDCQPQELLALKAGLKKATGTTVIVLDGERGILRVCQRDSEGLDLAARQGETVEKDLARRDVTFNAMAVASDGALLDPFGGSRDLADRKVRATSPEVLRDDPLRVLRCLRLAATLKFELENETRSLLARYAPNLSGVAGERIWDELLRFFAYTDHELLDNFRSAQLCAAIWNLEDSRVPWAWLEQWWAARPAGETLPRTSQHVLAAISAMLESTANSTSESQAAMDRLKMSRSQMKYLRGWWAGCAILRAGHPGSSREVLTLLKAVGESLNGLLSYVVLPAFDSPLAPALAQRIQLASTGQGELRLDPLPLDGDQLVRHWDREPGPWLGRMLAELETAWACRELNDAGGLLDYSASFL